ncbi:unnamed protein product [Oikopleura dioica]|uniref:Uncharacterized protein n=1 Tax=Oikopleura dioica TaxID=34765 RepID=E4XB92_OIKDI|nr:unnamed protein product [Oikopleura dioica]CBY31891.1 unnamed protein product [Oikopleura dioica]
MAGVVGTAHSCANPNTNVWNSRGIWISYIIVVLLLHFIILCIPVLTVEWCWTITNIVHSILMYLLMHSVKGTPFHTTDQGSSRFLTGWEQMDGEEQFTEARKFFLSASIVLYLLASFYTKYEYEHFQWNTAALLLSVLPKLPQFHRVRVFGINEY